LFEDLRREASRISDDKKAETPHAAMKAAASLATPDTPESVEVDLPTSDQSPEPRVFGDDEATSQPGLPEETPDLPSMVTFEAHPDQEEDDDGEESEFLRRRKRLAGLSREERIELRRQQEEEERKQRRALDSNLEMLSELKNVFRQGKQGDPKKEE